MYDLSYTRPKTVDEAAAALAKADSMPIAGGHTLLPILKQRLSRPNVTLVDLADLSELRGIHRSGKAIGIGAMTRHAEVARSADVKAAIPALAKLAGGIGDPQVRNRGTIGGSLATNDPAADYPAAVLALGATIVTNKRNIDADQYFTGMMSTALQPGEIIKAVGFPVPEKAGYARFEQRASRYALAGVFVAKTANGIRVAVTGAGEQGVFRSRELEAALTANFTPAAAAAAKVPSSNLASNLHGSAEWRAALIVALAEQAVATAA